MNIILVYNPRSGGALSKDELADMCNQNNIAIEAFVAVEGNVAKKLAPYIKQKKIIAVVGGDGTLSNVAGIITGSDAILAPLPGGTLNHFTKDLGVPQSIEDAFKALLHLKPKSIDIALVNNTVFINNSSVGLYPSSLLTRKKFENIIGKWPAAIIASTYALFRFRTYTVTINDETFETPFIFVGNNNYTLSGSGKVERTELTQGVLSIFIAKTTSRRVLFKIMLFAFIGKIKNIDEFEVRSAESLTLKTQRKYLSVSHDGEISHVNSPLQFVMRKKDLRVLGGK